MREIKFRVWDNKNKKWLLGCELPNLGGFSMFGEVMAFGEWTKVLESFSIEDWEYIKLMQFTGLEDRNGIEIYEGDIVSIPLYGSTIIIWNESICSFQYAYHAIGKGTAVGSRMTNTIYAHESTVKYEIIGNIYESPELLTPQPQSFTQP